ncbi:MAG: cytochrome c5 family protein [Betaproteobacteria bacterium]|nr:cytochrome c5 family protein [Betaproteobacteria bacterium]
MSDPHDTAHEPNPEGPIRTPKQLILAVLASFIVPIVGIVLLVNYVDFGGKPGAGSDGMSEEAVALRLQPVGTVKLGEALVPGALRSGEQVYTAVCGACHTAGVVGAPKSGDEAAWAPRIKTGYEALLNSALKGKGAMAAQGGGQYKDVEIARAVVYMSNKAGAKFDEPKAPEAAASAAK